MGYISQEMYDYGSNKSVIQITIVYYQNFNGWLWKLTLAKTYQQIKN
jgi:hypothetical protein